MIVRDVPCTKCGAGVGQPCTTAINGGRVRVYVYHDERVAELNRKLDETE